MRISDWSSDVCSSDLGDGEHAERAGLDAQAQRFRDGPGEGLAREIAVEPAAASEEISRVEPAGEQVAIGYRRGRAGLTVARRTGHGEAGRAWCGGRGCRYGSVSGVAMSLKKNK